MQFANVKATLAKRWGFPLEIGFSSCNITRGIFMSVAIKIEMKIIIEHDIFTLNRTSRL
jgi:hypothetical protein